MNSDRVDRELTEWAAHAPGLDVSGRHIIWRLQLAAKYIEQEISALDEGISQLSSSGARLLLYVITLPPPRQATPTLLGKRLSLTSGTMTSLIDRLESFGYVERQPDPDDRRGVLVRLTPGGLSKAEQLKDAYMAFESELLAALDDAEKAMLVGLLRKLLRGYERGSLTIQDTET